MQLEFHIYCAQNGCNSTDESKKLLTIPLLTNTKDYRKLLITEINKHRVTLNKGEMFMFELGQLERFGQLALSLGVIEYPRMKVEIFNHIPQSDLDYIIQNYSEGTAEKNFETLGRGAYGKVLGYKNYAIKRFHDSTSRSNRDISVLKDIGYLDCLPNIYACVENPDAQYKIMITERVKGITIGDYLEKDKCNTANVDFNFVKKFENALLKVVEAGYNPQDIHNFNVMIDMERKEPIIVDVGLFYKHGKKYKTIEEMRKNDSYRSAVGWTGDSLKKYIKAIMAKYEVREANNKERVEKLYTFSAKGIPLEERMKKVNWSQHVKFMEQMMNDIKGINEEVEEKEAMIKVDRNGIKIGFMEDIHIPYEVAEAPQPDIMHGWGAGMKSGIVIKPLSFKRAEIDVDVAHHLHMHRMHRSFKPVVADHIRHFHNVHFGHQHKFYEPQKPELPKNAQDVIKMKKDKPHFARDVVGVKVDKYGNKHHINPYKYIR